MMEKYADNLEELVIERTGQLVEEKKKTDALLERMLPRYVIVVFMIIISDKLAPIKLLKTKMKQIWRWNRRRRSGSKQAVGNGKTKRRGQLRRRWR